MAGEYVYNPLDRATYEAMAYNAIGRSSEIGTESRYALQHSTGNSGWSVGMIQTDFSSNSGHQQIVSTMLNNYQAWAPQDQKFTPQELTSLSQRLQVGGQTGNALTADEQSRLNGYLRSDSGREFVGGLDQKQIDREWQKVGQPLSEIPWLQKLSASDPAQAAEIVTMASKLYNQNETRGGRLLTELQNHEMTSAQTHDWIGGPGIDGLKTSAQSAIVSGRDNALAGVKLMNELELGHGTLAQAWHNEVHVNGDADLTRNFNNNPNAQLFDGMMRYPAHGETIFAHVDNGAPAKATTIQGGNATARLEMSHITQDNKGTLTVQNPGGDHFVLGQQGWSKNGVAIADPSQPGQTPANTAPNAPHAPTTPTQPTTPSQPHPAPHTEPAGLLKEGAHGTAVHELQADLAKLGYTGSNHKPLTADGNYGPDTKRAVESFQRDHHLKDVDGKAGPETLKALDQQVQAHDKQASKPTAPGLADKNNPDHALYQQALDGVHKLDATVGRASDQHSANLAASLVAAAKAEGLTRIDTVAMSADGTRTFAAQNTTPLKTIADVPTMQGMNTPMEQSSAAARTTQAPAQNQAQNQTQDQTRNLNPPQQQLPQPQPAR